MAAVSTAPAAPYITLNDILGAPQMCGTLLQTVSGVPNPFPTNLFTVTRKVIGDQARFVQYTGQRQTATQSSRNQPSKNRQLKELGVKDIILITVRENILLDEDDYQALINYDDLQMQNMGMEEVARQIKEAKTVLDNLRVATVAAALFTGQTNFDSAGNLLPSSVGATTTVNWSVPAGNQNQLNVFGNGNLIDAYWDSTTADIINQIVSIKQAAAELTGFPIKHAYYGRNILNFMATNTTVQAFLSRSAAAGGRSQGQQILDTGEMPDNFMGINWHPCYEFSYLDANNVVQTPVGDDNVIFTPEYSPNWWQFIEGTTVVPKSINIFPGEDAQSVQSNYDKRPGRWAYGVPIDDPPTAKILYGDRFICGPVVPAAIFQAVVSLNS
jgi:hypothetical protein